MGLLSGLFGGNKGTILTESPAGKKQDFLEASPYWDQSTVPVNTFKNKSPYTAKVVSCKRIVGPEATGETCHIIFDHKGNMPYWEGQSYGVIPPGTNPKNGKPHTVRLYSIASSRYGDNMAGKTSSLCVRRATYWDPDMGKEDPAKKGVCSNFLCDATAGEQVKMTGPTGKVMLMPEEKADTDYIMVATGTGIAPYRGFIRRLFTETTPAGEAYKGLAWLFLGVANSDALLYDEEWQAVWKSNSGRPVARSHLTHWLISTQVAGGEVEIPGQFPCRLRALARREEQEGPRLGVGIVLRLTRSPRRRVSRRVSRESPFHAGRQDVHPGQGRRIR